MIIEIDEFNFHQAVLNSDKLFVVDFWKKGCGPCDVIGKIIQKIVKDYEEKVVFGIVNVELSLSRAELNLQFSPF